MTQYREQKGDRRNRTTTEILGAKNVTNMTAATKCMQRHIYKQETDKDGKKFNKPHGSKHTCLTRSGMKKEDEQSSTSTLYSNNGNYWPTNKQMNKWTDKAVSEAEFNRHGQ